MKLQSNTWGFLMAVIGVLLFSAKAILVKLCYQEGVSADVITTLFFRMLIALPFYCFIFVIQLRKSSSLPSLSVWLSILILGCLGYYIASYFDFLGLSFISASLERLILFVYPTIVVLLSSIFLKAPISRLQLMSILITYLGLIVIFWENIFGPSDVANLNILKGAGFILISAFTYACYLVGSQWVMKKLTPQLFTSFAMIAACIAVIIHYFTVHGWGSWTGLSNAFYGYAFIMAIFCTVIPSFLISAGISIIGANTVSIIGSLGPVSTIFLSVLFLGEMMSLVQLIGGLIIIFGVVLVKK